MKRIMIKLPAAFLLLTLSFCMLPLSAQTEEQIQRFKQEMESYYNEKLQLTPAEKEKFWPLYNDFYNRKIKLDENERITYRYCHNNVHNMSDQEIIQSLEKIMQLKDEKHRLYQEYHEKFLEILPPKKVLMLYKVERDFRMHLIKQLRRHGRGWDDKRKGPGGSRGPDAGMGPGSDVGPGADAGPAHRLPAEKGRDSRSWHAPCIGSVPEPAPGSIQQVKALPL